MTYTMRIRRKTYRGASLAEMSATYTRLRDKSGLGASKFGEAKIIEHGIVVARISYNGRVWNPAPWKVGDVPIYDSRLK